MGRSRRNIMAVAEETSTPPPMLKETQSIARIIKAEGKSLYSCSLPNQETIFLAELPSRFRNAIWLRRGSYVLIDTKDANSRQNKIKGEIINIVRNENIWRKQLYWPEEFAQKSYYLSDNEENESNIGRMPPSDSDNE